MRADDAATNDATALFVKDQLGEALGAAIGQGTARGAPREQALVNLGALRLGLLLRDAHPRNLWVGVGH
jgi:hypothetical protein